MKLILRLVGYSEIIDDEKYCYQIYYNAYVFNFDILKTKFSEYQIDDQQTITNIELDNCTVTCNSKNLKKETLVDESENSYRLFIFCGNLEIRKKLIAIFVKFGEKSLINQQITSNVPDTVSLGNSSDTLSHNEDNMLDSFSLGDNEDNISDSSSKSEDSVSDSSSKSGDNISDSSSKSDESDDEIYDFSNVELNLEIFKDHDFLNIIKIYNNRPELFKDFYKYISSSYLVKLENNNDIDYSNNLESIKNINLNFSDDQIINSLKLTNNHINLALRYLITTKIE
tara:strand:+ start:808 stop:1659 length:852 start_codon:yes stop_codon:yes gene_type:complete